ncbi:MAG: deoxyribodipyrimidine photo-lyase [Bryobacterales bacterium]|nr:deoxyribodipyrimidine photo-lyase [Bryobacterales bacterium]
MLLRREFQSREELADFLRAEFPAAAARDGRLSPWPGGLGEARRRLAAMEPEHYAKTRNFLDGAVTRLSPYIRHGVVSLTATMHHALAMTGGSPRRIYKFIAELAWRDYWQRLYAQWGAGVWEDREEYKTGWPAASYAAALPDDLLHAQTGLACMDAFAAELYETGYLHNHARMWLASYVVHWRRVRWQAGARWFLTHLLDGDPASNNLSWQWVASTFSHQPYIFNRENLEKYTEGRYCRTCRAACPFAADYPELTARLFPRQDSTAS